MRTGGQLLCYLLLEHQHTKYLQCVEYSDVFGSDSLIYFTVVLQHVLKVWVIFDTFVSLQS
jgi:hypothetical protein